MPDSKTILDGERTIPFSPALAKAFGICGALLIQQIHFWVSTHPNQRDGFGWCYQTYESWAQQLSYSAREIRRTIKDLENCKVIASGVFNHHKYDRTRWYRVDYAGLCKALEMLLGCKWQIRTDPNGKQGQIHLVKVSTPIPKTSPEINTDMKTSGKPLGEEIAAIQPHGQEEEKTEEEIEKFGDWGHNPHVTAKEIVQKKAEKPEGKLECTWKEAVSLESDGAFQYELTVKQKAQLKKLADRCGAETRDLIKWVIPRWTKFANKAMSAKGLDTYPSDPDIGYLLMACDVAMNMRLQSIVPEKPKVVEIPKVTPAPVAAPPKHEKAMLTPDELAAFLKELHAS